MHTIAVRIEARVDGELAELHPYRELVVDDVYTLTLANGQRVSFKVLEFIGGSD